jgi:hypothetical protein
MKVLFLDIDGVMNNFHMRNFGQKFSEPSRDALNSIVERVPELKIVISSAWRMHGLVYMQKMLHKNKIKGALDEFDGTNVIDCTGREDGIRGHQIQCWLDRNPGVTSFVILDDESDMGHLMDKLVKTNSFVGLTSKEADRAVEILNK